MSIPDRLIFIWFGDGLPYACRLALQSAYRQCRPGEILLIADRPDSIRTQLEAMGRLPRLRLEAAGPHWFEALPPGGNLARELFLRSREAAAKSNLLRLAALYREGGIYLDCDTITVRDLAPLRNLPGFAGAEPVVFPAGFFLRRNPLKWIGAGLRLAVREALARLPGGWRRFRRLESCYFSAANNAVMGAEAGHAFLAQCFAALEAIPPDDRLRRFRLGTHLLQSVHARSGDEAFVLLPAASFFPLGPEISNHWFFPGTAKRVSDILLPDTYVVHWYNSVEGRFLKQALSEDWVRNHPDSAFAELVRRFC